MSHLGPQPVASKDVEDKLTEMDSIPLFMRSLPEDESDNVAISALQNLAYEGTPDEISQNFKEQGNEYFKGKRYREAVGFYQQGLDAKPEDKTVLEALLCNRAACNLELKNYGSVLRDCSHAIALNGKCAKAYYRSSLALLALGRIDEAADCCKRCLEFDPNNEGMKAVQDKTLKGKEIREAKVRLTQERQKAEHEERRKFQAAYKERNIIDVPRPEGSSNPYAPHWDTDDLTGPNLIIPVFFLYPQYATSDVITEFIETTSFSAHLEVMFPPGAPAPEWDKAHEYVNGKLVIYAITRRKRLFKVGKNLTLRDVCAAAKNREGQPIDGLELKDGCLTFVVVPKGDVERKWVDEFKAARDGH